MLKHSLKISALALSLSLTGCFLDGDKGDKGDTGAAGVQGPAGNNGANGTNGTNATAGITVQLVGRAKLGGEGAAEIVQYHEATKTAYAVNSAGNAPTIDAISLSSLTSTLLADPLTATNLNATSQTLPTSYNNGNADIQLGGANSIAIHGDWMAVAMEAKNHADNGAIVFYNGLESGTPTWVKTVEAGNLPDMVTFTPDGSKVLVANEGEPSGDYVVDPEGGISIIAVTNGIPANTATHLNFRAFNGMQTDLEAKGMRFPNPNGKTIKGKQLSISVAQDLEPEYITATNTHAYVSLQENNGLAVVNLADNSITLVGLGYKSWKDLSIDVSDKDGGLNFKKFDGLYGMYQPDTLDSYSWKGATFVISANEGDGREYFFDAADEATCLAQGGIEYDKDDGCLAYTDEARVKDLTLDPNSPLAVNYDKKVLGRLKVTPHQGDANNDGEHETLYTFGGRSFSIWDQNGLMVFDSGDDVGRVTASVHGQAFNNDNDENEGDTRSDAKGAEPEALTIGMIGSQTYAFVGLERMSGIMVYNITNPYNVTFVDYFINRDTTESADPTGDLAPEGMAFVKAADSATGKALLLVGNEVSGTVAVWEISPK